MSLADLGARGAQALQAGGLAPAVVALVAFCEALVVVGVFVPLTPLLVAIGAGIAAGKISPSILAWAMAGAMAGNLASYGMGRGLGASKRSPPRLPAAAVRTVENLFRRHGALAVVLSRYLGPPATITPFLAGWSGLAMGRFMVASLVASLTWPPAMALIGYAGVLGWRIMTCP